MKTNGNLTKHGENNLKQLIFNPVQPAQLLSAFEVSKHWFVHGGSQDTYLIEIVHSALEISQNALPLLLNTGTVLQQQRA